MKRVLPINANSRLKSYVHHSYPHSIVDRELIATLFVKEIGEWSDSETDVIIERDCESNLLHIKESAGRKDTSYGLERNCKKNDEILVKIKKINLMDALSYVMVYLERDDDSSNQCLAFHWNQYDITIGEEHYVINGHFESYYRVKKEGELIRVSISSDLVSWVELCTKRVEDKANLLKFGIQFFFGDNQYEQWLNMNYIQLFYNKSDVNTVYLDYFVFPQKNNDASFQQMCQFLDTEYVEFQGWMNSDYERLHSFIISSIENGFYLNICLNEYWIPKRHSYNKFRYDHYNLIYGYDEDKREYKILGYDWKGKVTLGIIEFDLLEKCIVSRPIVRYVYRVNKYVFKFQIGYVIEMLEEFVGGKDSSKRYGGLLTATEGTYGIRIFSELLNTVEGKNLVLEDKRISFLLYEHCKLMLGRLNYLIEKRYLGVEKCSDLTNQCNKMVKTAERLKNQVIKNKICDNLEGIIWKTLLDLKNQEYEFCENLITSLKNNYTKN